MTREEATAILNTEADFLFGNDKPYNRQAFDMAVEALQDCGKYKGDLISRQAVLALFEERFLELQIAKRLPENKVQEYVQSGVNWCINTVRDMPSVENKGEWIYTDGQHVCSKCNLYNGIESDFCPNCGADMRGE